MIKQRVNEDSANRAQSAVGDRNGAQSAVGDRNGAQSAVGDRNGAGSNGKSVKNGVSHHQTTQISENGTKQVATLLYSTSIM